MDHGSLAPPARSGLAPAPILLSYRLIVSPPSRQPHFSRFNNLSSGKIKVIELIIVDTEAVFE